MRSRGVPGRCGRLARALERGSGAGNNAAPRDRGSRSWRCRGTVTHPQLSPAAAPSNVLSCCRWSLGPAGAPMRARGKGGRGWGRLPGRRQQRRGVLDASSRGRGRRPRALGARAWRAQCTTQRQLGSRDAGAVPRRSNAGRTRLPFAHARCHPRPPTSAPIGAPAGRPRRPAPACAPAIGGGARRVVGLDLARRMVKSITSPRRRG